MRAAVRLLASVQRSQFLEPGAPTGLTGLLTHASPRSTLLYLYNSTLDRLKEFPESSVYRQSTEALTKHRLSIVESVKPAGLEEWQARVKSTIEAHPKAFMKIPTITGASEFNIVWREDPTRPLDTDTSDVNYMTKSPGENPREFDKLKQGLVSTRRPEYKPELEGPRTVEERKDQGMKLAYDAAAEHAALPAIEAEPSLSADQISDMENQIGAGLIEEVIQVAEGEKELVDTLAGSRVWEDLEEKPAEGQWSYYERRDTHTPTTQAR